ncbi:MAG: hypothetical protein ACLU84_08950 [Clostridia bacterium]
MSEYGKNKNVQKMEEKIKRIIKLLVTTVLLSALFAITVFAEESKALEIQKADEKVMYDSSTFYEKYTTVDGWWGDDFEVPYQCHVKMLVCGQNTGGKMTVQWRVNNVDNKPVSVNMDGKAISLDLGVVQAGKHKFDIWTNGFVIVSIIQY